MQALCDEAHALGRKVMCHALGGAGLRVALEAGVDSIEHGCYLDEDPELIPMMAERGVFFVPTLTVYEYHSESKAPHVQERSRALREHHVESIRRAMAKGVKVVAGTDAGGHGHPPNAAELQLPRRRRPHADAGDPGRDRLSRPSAWAPSRSSARSRRASARTSSWSTATRSPTCGSCRIRRASGS